MNPKTKKGIALIIVLSFILLLVIAAASFMIISSSEIRMVREQNNSTKAFYLAEAGIEHARAQLCADWDDRGSLPSPGTSLGDGTYYFYIYDTDASGVDLPGDKLRIKATGDVGGVKRAVEVILNPPFDPAKVTSAIEVEGDIVIKGSAEVNGGIREKISVKLDTAEPAGDTTISVTSVSGLVVGDYLLIDAGTSEEEEVKISSINVADSDVTLENGLSSSHSINANVTRVLSFEDTFGLGKETLEKIAQKYYPDTYYNTAFNNGTATGITWINSPTEQSQITTNDWTGSGILIVNGDLKITGGTFDGVIWVMGELRISGNPVVSGGIFVECGITVDTDITGNAEINYDSDKVKTAFSLPPTIDSWREVPE